MTEMRKYVLEKNQTESNNRCIIPCTMNPHCSLVPPVPVVPAFSIGLFWEFGPCQFGYLTFGLTDLERSPGCDHCRPHKCGFACPHQIIKVTPRLLTWQRLSQNPLSGVSGTLSGTAGAYPSWYWVRGGITVAGVTRLPTDARRGQWSPPQGKGRVALLTSTTTVTYQLQSFLVLICSRFS